MSRISIIKKAFKTVPVWLLLVCLLSGCSLSELPAVTVPLPSKEEAGEIPEPDPELYFYYAELDASQQKLYRELAAVFEAAGEELRLSALKHFTQEDVEEVFHAILYDRPDYFWVSDEIQSVLLGDDVVRILPEYLMSAEEIESARGDLLAYACKLHDTWLGKIASDAEKERSVHDFLARGTEYGSSDMDQTVWGCLWEGRCVCAGYTRAFQYLLQREGIPCYFCSGEAVTPDGKREEHSWNIVKLDGKYYAVDVTWDDQEELELVSYRYFNMTDEVLSADHFADSYGKMLPACRTEYDFEGTFGYSPAVAAAMAYAGNDCLIRNTEDYAELVWDTVEYLATRETSPGRTEIVFVVPSEEGMETLRAYYRDACFEEAYEERLTELFGGAGYAWDTELSWKSFDEGVYIVTESITLELKKIREVLL